MVHIYKVNFIRGQSSEKIIFTSIQMAHIREEPFWTVIYKEKVFLFRKLANLSMKANGEKINLMEKESKFIQMGLVMRVCMLMGWNRIVMESIDLVMGKYMRDHLKKDIWKDKENYTCQTVTDNISDNSQKI